MRGIAGVRAGVGCFLVLGCAPRAVNLMPESIPPTHGAVLGRIRVFKGESEVTSACYVELTDDSDQQVGRLSLDKTGWVATSLKKGETHLSFISCAVWNGLTYRPRSLQFEVRGDGTVTYFGHLRFDLEDRDAEITGAAVAGVLAAPVGDLSAGIAAGTAAASSAQGSGNERVSVFDEAADASHAYAEKYRVVPNLFKSLAAEPWKAPDPSPVVTKRGDVVSTQVRTDGMRVTLIALVRPETRWLGVRLTHETKKPELSACQQIELTVDQTTRRLPAVYRATPVGAFVQEGLSVALDVETFRSIVNGAKVRFDACGRTSDFPKIAASAADEVLASFESRVAAVPSDTAAADAGASAAAEQRSAAGPGVPNAGAAGAGSVEP